jgi:hypothetical protein
MNCQPTGFERRWSKKARDRSDESDLIAESNKLSDLRRSAVVSIERGGLVGESIIFRDEMQGFTKPFLDCQLDVSFFAE